MIVYVYGKWVNPDEVLKISETSTEVAVYFKLEKQGPLFFTKDGEVNAGSVGQAIYDGQLKAMADQQKVITSNMPTNPLTSLIPKMMAQKPPFEGGEITHRPMEGAPRFKTDAVGTEVVKPARPVYPVHVPHSDY